MIRKFLGESLDAARRKYPHTRLKELRAREYLDKGRLTQLQEEKLSALLGHAYAHVPYYREVLAQTGVADAHGRINLQNFRKIPFLTKALLREQWENLKSDDLQGRRWKHNFSGGSTGEPARFIQDVPYDDYVLALKSLFDLWSGCPIGHRKVLLWGSDRDLPVHKNIWRSTFSRWLRNQQWLSAFQMTPQDMEQYAQIMGQFKPCQVLGYVESVYEFARFVKSRKIPLYSPKAVMTSAGMLYPHMRSVIEDVFGAPVFNRYGSREVGDIASECDKHEGLHVVPLTHYLEVLRPDGSPAPAGEDGEIAVTLLTNYAMPLIRYKIGDRAVWSAEDCSCGRTWPLLKSISGRITDVFKKKDGGLVPSEYFVHVLSLYSNELIKKFQIIQEDYDSIRIKLVFSSNGNPGPEAMSAPELMEIKQQFQRAMGSGCAIVCEAVQDIPAASSGKFRHVFSLVNHEDRP